MNTLRKANPVKQLALSPPRLAGVGVKMGRARFRRRAKYLLDVPRRLSVIWDQRQVDRDHPGFAKQGFRQIGRERPIQSPLQFRQVGHRRRHGVADRLIRWAAGQVATCRVNGDDSRRRDQQDLKQNSTVALGPFVIEFQRFSQPKLGKSVRVVLGYDIIRLRTHGSLLGKDLLC